MRSLRVRNLNVLNSQTAQSALSKLFALALAFLLSLALAFPLFRRKDGETRKRDREGKSEQQSKQK